MNPPDVGVSALPLWQRRGMLALQVVPRPVRTYFGTSNERVLGEGAQPRLDESALVVANKLKLLRPAYSLEAHPCGERRLEARPNLPIYDASARMRKNTLSSDTAGLMVSRWPPILLSWAMAAGSSAWGSSHSNSPARSVMQPCPNGCSAW